MVKISEIQYGFQSEKSTIHCSAYGCFKKTQEFRKLLHVVFVDLEKSPLLFVIIIDYIEEGTQWAMLFADNLVLCDPD